MEMYSAQSDRRAINGSTGMPPRGASWARPAVVLTVVPLMVLAVGLIIAIAGWRLNVDLAQTMAEDRLDDEWQAMARDLEARFGASDALLAQVEVEARRLDGSQDPAAWYRALVPLFTGRPELSYASFSTPEGRFYGLFSDGTSLNVNFDDQSHGGGYRHRWRIIDGSPVPALEDKVGYDPRNRPFWRAALIANAPVWTEPYRFFSPTQQVGISRTHALYDAQHHLLGVATVDWTMDAFSRYLAKAGLGIADRVIVAADDGALLAVRGLPIPPAATLDAPVERVSDVKDCVTHALFAARAEPGQQYLDVTDPSSGERYLAIRRTLDHRLGWTLAIAARREPLLAPARHHLLATAIGVALVMPMALLISWIYARHVVRVNRELGRARDAASAAAAEAQQLRIDRERQRLEQLCTLGLLAGGIAHDVRNSITCVTAIADLLHKKPQDTDKVVGYADMLSRSAAQANQLCEDLLRFGRRGSETPVEYDAHDAVRSAVNVYSTSGRDVDIDLAGLQASRHLVHGNRNQLQIAILNLFLNSRDAMHGAGTVIISSSVREITAEDVAAAQLSMLSPGPHLVLTVADSGKGMDAETLRRCLEPFFTPTGELGTGLGLQTVLRVVKEHHGAIDIASAPGQGTTVTLMLPLVAARHGSMGNTARHA